MRGRGKGSRLCDDPFLWHKNPGILVHSDSTPLKHLALKINQANVDQNVRQNVQSLLFDLVNLEVCAKFSLKLPALSSNFYS